MRRLENHSWNRCLRSWSGVLLIMILSISTGFAPPQKLATEEYQLKAIFLFNFAQFVEWPAEVFQEPDSPIVIGILGKDPFGVFLQETVEGEQVNGHPLVIEHYDNVNDIKNCHILFINQSTTRLDDVLKELEGKDILTVSDGNNFTKLGGMIRFKNDSKKIKLQINLTAVKGSDITISSKLLRLSEIVE
jgi:hypothetical protein